MALYDFRCGACNLQKEISLRIADRDNVINCEECGRTMHRVINTSFRVSDPIDLGRVKPNSDFRNFISEVRKRTRGHNIADRWG